MLQRVIGEPLRDIENCINQCQKDADLTLERLILTIIKCQVNYDCYYNELHSVIKILYPCILKCVQ